jgi:hypothetical protein
VLAIGTGSRRIIRPMEFNEQTLDRILTNQREEFQRTVVEQGDRLDRSLREQREEFKLYMGVQIEALRSDIQGVADGVLSNTQQLAGLRETVAKNTAEIEQTGLQVLALRTDFAGMRKEMEMVRLEMEMMRSELSIIRSDLKAKAGRDELAILEARVAKLERAGRI